MNNIEFGIMDGFGDVDSYPSAADAYDQHISDALRAEQLGYGYYFFIEHQNAPFAYISSPSVYLAALAARTSSLRFGPMVYQLPMHNPIRLAQDAAMVDSSRGAGWSSAIGYGIHAHEFMRWELPFSERRAMGVEAMEIILKAWTEDTVTYKGEYWSFDEALPKPKPYQQPYPPRLGRRSQQDVVRLRGQDELPRRSEHRRRRASWPRSSRISANAWKEQGHAGRCRRHCIARHVHVAETDAAGARRSRAGAAEGLLRQRRGDEADRRHAHRLGRRSAR